MATFLKKGEKPFRIVRAKARGPCIIVCDHASHAIPQAFRKTFGVPKKELMTHAGVDIGAAALSRDISRRLNTPAVLATFSRLFIEMNRPPVHAQSIQRESHGIKIPGNAKLTRAQRKERVDTLFWPYQYAVTAQVNRFLSEGRMPFQLYVHSFTPEPLYGKKRPWHAGILWNAHNKRESQAFIRNLKKQNPRLVIGSNQPYSLDPEDPLPHFTAVHHGEKRDLPYIFIEVRNDQIDTPAKAARWGRIIVRALAGVLPA